MKLISLLSVLVSFYSAPAFSAVILHCSESRLSSNQAQKFEFDVDSISRLGQLKVSNETIPREFFCTLAKNQGGGGLAIGDFPFLTCIQKESLETNYKIEVRSSSMGLRASVEKIQNAVTTSDGNFLDCY